MSPEEYQVLKTHLNAKLLQIFTYVSIPPHVHDKLDHGDFDTLLCQPKGVLSGMSDVASMQNEIKNHMGAVQARNRDGIMFLGIPFPYMRRDDNGNLHIVNDMPQGANLCLDVTSLDGAHTFDSLSQISELSLDGIIINAMQKHFEVDVKLCDAPSQLAWSAFRFAHGDLFPILKVGLQPYDFALRDSGLFGRIPEIARLGSPGSVFFLSNDVRAILEFLGLDYDQYERGFANVEELFKYATSSLLFSRAYHDSVALDISGVHVKDDGQVEIDSRGMWMMLIFVRDSRRRPLAKFPIRKPQLR